MTYTRFEPKPESTAGECKDNFNWASFLKMILYITQNVLSLKLDISHCINEVFKLSKNNYCTIIMEMSLEL